MHWVMRNYWFVKKMQTRVLLFHLIPLNDFCAALIDETRHGWECRGSWQLCWKLVMGVQPKAARGWCNTKRGRLFYLLMCSLWLQHWSLSWVCVFLWEIEMNLGWRGIHIISNGEKILPLYFLLILRNLVRIYRTVPYKFWTGTRRCTKKWSLLRPLRRVLGQECHMS